MTNGIGTVILSNLRWVLIWLYNYTMRASLLRQRNLAVKAMHVLCKDMNAFDQILRMYGLNLFIYWVHIFNNHCLLIWIWGFTRILFGDATRSTVINGDKIRIRSKCDQREIEYFQSIGHFWDVRMIFNLQQPTPGKLFHIPTNQSWRRRWVDITTNHFWIVIFINKPSLVHPLFSS